MQVGPNEQVRVKKNRGFEAVVESATKGIGISELKKEQGLAACSFVRGNGVCHFATDGATWQVYLFCPPSTSF